jgi:hypothetical protein
MRIPVDPSFDPRDPYKVLGVAADATPVEVRKAYLALAKQHHPNLFATNPERYRLATALMTDINTAYELLRDPARREFWDRAHPAARRRPGPRQAARRAVKPGEYYDAEQVHRIIRKNNEFVGTLRTPQDRRRAVLRIRRFQASRAGAAYIRELVNRHYWKVMELLRQGRRITVYDDGLVEMMFLFDGALEVAPSEVFITYAWLTFRENRGKVPSWLAPPGRGKGGPGEARVRIQLPRHAGTGAEERKKRERSVGAKVWEWLMAKPGQG